MNDHVLQLEVLESASIEEQKFVILKQIKEYLANKRKEAEEILLNNGGLACANYLSQAHDTIIKTLFELAKKRYPAQNPSSQEKIAIVAVGGYGRNTLAPGSDIDILFLLPSSTAWGESIAEAILYPLWDLGLKVGHATRTISECVRAAKTDITICTALLEARLIVGDKSLFTDFENRFEKDVVAKNKREFVLAKLNERDERIQRAGQSLYLVEPNIKEGKGGMRDLQTLFWIMRYVYNIKDRKEIAQTGLFTPREISLLARCEEFLWRMRCHMHFISKKTEDRLSFDLQRMVASSIGYKDRSNLSGVERFMKHYFFIAQRIGDLSTLVIADLEARDVKPKAILDRFVRRLRKKTTPLTGTSVFIVENGRINITNTSIFENDPVNMIRLYWYADKDQLPIHPHAQRLVTLSLRLIDDSIRHNIEANSLFLDILTSRRSPEAVLRLMHESGVLGRFIPDFGRISAMMQFSMYHHYTVDEHTLRCIGILSQLERGELAEDHPLAHAFLPFLQHRRALYVGLFLHDIGKGRTEAHEIVGARVARELCPRLGLLPNEVDTIAWLIENHLVMSQVAQSRDISDPRTISTFSDKVQTLERLRLLLALTVCDIRGVGPNVWNGWKGQLLRALYSETEVYISGNVAMNARGERILSAQNVLKQSLKDWDEKRFSTYLQKHPPIYWLKVDLPHQILHAKMIEKSDDTGERFQVEISTDAFRGVTELNILAIDHPRLLSIITGACAAAGANIAGAQIFTTQDGLALDTIMISRAFPRDEDEIRRARKIGEHIVSCLKGNVRLPEIIASRQKQTRLTRAFTVPPEIMIDNELSAKASVVEVTGLDRPGLLYELTTEFGKQNLNIISARIVTYGEKAVDVFYITDLVGGKITETSKKQRLKRAILTILES